MNDDVSAPARRPEPSPEQPHEARVRHVAAALALAAIALTLRLVGLGGGLLQDEFGTLWVVEGSLGDVFRRTLEFHGQSPLYYLFPWAAIQVFGESEWALRLSSVVFGVLTCGVLFLLGRDLRGPALGWVLAFMAALLPHTVRYSAQARPYALAALFVSLAFLGFFRAVRTGARRDRALFVLGALGTFYAHYLLAAALLGIPLAYALERASMSSYDPRRFTQDLALAGVLSAPGVLHFASLALRRDELAHIANPAYGQTVKVLAPSLALAAAAWVVARVRRGRVPLDLLARATALSLVIGVLGFALLAAAGVHLIADRYLFGFAVAALILAGLFVGRLAPRDRALLLAGWTLALAGYYVREFQHQGTFNLLGRGADWRGATEALIAARRDQPGLPVLFRSGFVEDRQLPLKPVSACIRAPLRSPGRPPAGPEFVPLCRWADDPAVVAYFESQVLPHTSGGAFLLVSPQVEAPGDDLLRWLESETGRGWSRTALFNRGAMVVQRFEAR